MACISLDGNITVGQKKCKHSKINAHCTRSRNEQQQSNSNRATTTTKKPYL